MGLRQSILVLLFVFIGVDAWAGDLKLIVWLNDGSTMEIPIKEDVEFVYNNGAISVKGDHMNFLWSLSNLEKFTFGSVQPMDVKMVEKQQLNTLSDRCMVYDHNGKLIKRRIHALSELPKGIYIIKDNKITMKVVCK